MGQLPGATPASPRLGAGATALNVVDVGAVGDGRTDDTAAIQRALAGAAEGTTVVFPGGRTFALSGGLAVGRRLVLTGGGVLSFVAGIEHGPALRLAADGCRVDGLRLRNPNLLRAVDGEANTGILVAANDVVVTGCHLELFQYGIAVQSTGGEFTDIVISQNRVADVLGSGSSTSDAGEDRGDGITVWGARVSVVGNVVSAAEGTDARIGIHCEALSAGRNRTFPAHTDALVTVSGNVVRGRFRRGIVCEEMRAVTITGNVVADPTWWGIALIASADCAVTGNTVVWTRTAADLQGETFAPRRCALHCLGGVRNSVFTGNVVRAAAGSALFSYFTATAADQLDPPTPTDVLVADNGFAADDGADVRFGVTSDVRTTRLRVRGNTVRGFTERGFWGFGAERAEIRDNLFEAAPAATGDSVGVHCAEDSGDDMSICGNTVRGTATGILRANGSGTLITGNTVEAATRGIDCWGTERSMVSGNVVRVPGPEKIVNVDAARELVVRDNLTP
ncbi:Nitrous oxidase accessory protein NosD, contains tandem CASH domains [Amycolatopsis arida]|uniref:Nitrous oxidase accessory protein NosD, contains tandem CASH domains n=1 Tax=Amycolatopsis arida TaxID=587909 RepID=A0A1I5XEQ4_9PSEU|nr:right-handed parallel beta-helix repeat-containing protein [Amycolatopsis arida]TDX97498.1 nitrous oxidase accessory protein NosD [Amycolatopsis arida]SFQ30440.1 Nitrous oxidase accessory protein NosD, contains tandem CASH domains [Amycolatopsis arida]